MNLHYAMKIATRAASETINYRQKKEKFIKASKQIFGPEIILSESDLKTLIVDSNRVQNNIELIHKWKVQEEHNSFVKYAFKTGKFSLLKECNPFQLGS